MSRRHALALLVLGVFLHGCASNMAGLDSSPRYACKAPAGSQCTSVSGVYANSIQGQLLAARVTDPPPAAASAPAPAPTAAALAPPAPVPLIAHPLRAPARVLRLWIAPWDDSDGDLNEAAVVHVLVDPGVWLIERIRPAPTRPQEVTAPPKPANPPPPAAGAPAP